MPVIFLLFPRLAAYSEWCLCDSKFQQEYRWLFAVPRCLEQRPMAVCLNIWCQISRCCLRADWVRKNSNCCQPFGLVHHRVIVGRRLNSHSDWSIEKCSTRRDQIEWSDNCFYYCYFSQKKRHVKRKKGTYPRSSKPTAQHIHRQMYFVHRHGLHVYFALVDLNSSGSPGVYPTLGLTSSTQVVCVCVRAYTSTHPPTTLTPAKIEEYTSQNPYLYPYQNIASHASNKR